jgi:hypothetical protein
MIGLIMMCLSLGLSSLSTTVPHLIASQGVFYAIGGALCYSSTIMFMDEWFVKRKGLAFGLMWVGICRFAVLQMLTSEADLNLRRALVWVVSLFHYFSNFCSTDTASAPPFASGLGKLGL